MDKFAIITVESNAAKLVIASVINGNYFTISDFVSDLRAPTPTAAAELSVPNTIDLINYIKQLEIRASKSMENIIDTKKSRLNSLTAFLKRFLTVVGSGSQF